MPFLPRPLGARGSRPADVAINRSSPQARGLEFWAVADLALAGGMRDVVRQQAATRVGSTVGPVPAGEQGVGFSTGTANEYSTIPYTSPSTNTCTFTAWLYARSLDALGLGCPVLSTNPRGQGLSQNRGTTNDSLVGFWDITLDEYDADTGLVIPLNQWFLGVFAVGPTAGITYIVSRAGLKSWTNTKTHTAKVIDTMGFGSDAGIPSRVWDGMIGDCRVYPTRTFSSGEVWDLYHNRFDLCLTTARPFFDVGAAAAAAVIRNQYIVRQSVNRSATF